MSRASPNRRIETTDASGGRAFKGSSTGMEPMSSDAREFEVAQLLARGVFRLRERSHLAVEPSGTKAADSVDSGLEVSSKPRPDGQRG